MIGLDIYQDVSSKSDGDVYQVIVIAMLLNGQMAWHPLRPTGLVNHM